MSPCDKLQHLVGCQSHTVGALLAESVYGIVVAVLYFK